jgi:hypothetical protein
VLLGVLAVLGFLGLVVVVHVAKKPELVLGTLDPKLLSVPTGLAAFSPNARALVAEVEALGFELQGVFTTGVPGDSAGGVKTSSPLKSATIFALFLSGDRLVEAAVSSISVLFEKKTARGSFGQDFVTFYSYGENDRFCGTHNLGVANRRAVHPTSSWRRLPPGTRPAALLAAHEDHVRSRGLETVALAAAEYERRFATRHCEELWHFEARGLVRFEGNLVKETRLFRLRNIVHALSPGLAEARPLLGFLGHLLLGALGAALATRLAGLGELAEAALFLALATAALALFRRSVIAGAFYVCMPAAVVFGLSGELSYVPWLAVYFYAILGSLVVQRLRFRREKARQERTLEAVKKPAPPSSSGA